MIIVDPSNFIINRANWSFGKGQNSRLADNGKFDCIGFLLKAAGVPDAILENKSEPIDIRWEHEWNSKLFIEGTFVYQQSAVCTQIIKTNDDPNLNRDEREAKLIELFGKIGIKLEFVDEATVS